MWAFSGHLVLTLSILSLGPSDGPLRIYYDALEPESSGTFYFDKVTNIADKILKISNLRENFIVYLYSWGRKLPLFE